MSQLFDQKTRQYFLNFLENYDGKMRINLNLTRYRLDFMAKVRGVIQSERNSSFRSSEAKQRDAFLTFNTRISHCFFISKGITDTPKNKLNFSQLMEVCPQKL